MIPQTRLESLNRGFLSACLLTRELRSSGAGRFAEGRTLRSRLVPRAERPLGVPAGLDTLARTSSVLDATNGSRCEYFSSTLCRLFVLWPTVCSGTRSASRTCICSCFGCMVPLRSLYARLVLEMLHGTPANSVAETGDYSSLAIQRRNRAERHSIARAQHGLADSAVSFAIFMLGERNSTARRGFLVGDRVHSLARSHQGECQNCLFCYYEFRYGPS